MKPILYLSRFVSSLVLAGIAVAAPAFSQPIIRSDNSLSTAVSSSDNLNFTIESGDRIGDNLFHSFETFSVPTTGSAAFANPADIENIISRVTGSSLSTIDGLIQANGAANLFLVNPNGIVFGPNAQLSIGGSFLGSTAESLQFSDGTEFIATHAAAPFMLTVSTPVGLQLGASSKDIQVRDAGYTTLSAIPLMVDSSSSLRVGSGSAIALIGRNILFDGGTVSAPAGHIELGGVQAGQVIFNLAVGSFHYQDVERFGEITLSSQSLINASDLLFGPTGAPIAFGPRAGSIQIRGQQLSVQEDSKVLLQNFGSNPFGSIHIDVEETIELAESGVNRTGRSGIFTSNFGEGLTGGNINVSARQLHLFGNADLSTETLGNAPGGHIRVDVSDKIRYTPSTSAEPGFGNIQTASYSAGKSGDVDVITGQLLIDGEGMLGTSEATGIVSQTTGTGDGGDVRVSAESILLTNGGSISAATLGEGAGGDVAIAADTIEVIGVAPLALLPSIIAAAATKTGNAGNVIIDTQKLLVKSGGRVDSSTLAFGDAGSVTVTASELVDVRGTVPGSVNPSLIISSANVVDSNLRIFFASIGSPLPEVPTGASGDVTISAPIITVGEGAQVTAKNDGTGNAGTLTLNADTVSLDSDSGITASTVQGSGGNISLNLEDLLLLRRGSQVSAEAGGAGNSGNIILNVPVLVALENSDIVANAVQGTGGNIQINTQGILGTELRSELTPASDITASSQFGVSGTVEITNLQVDPSSGTIELPTETADSSGQVAAACSETSQNWFVASGRGGLPVDPARLVQASHLWLDFREVSNMSNLAIDRAPAREPIVQETALAETRLVEANGWRRDNKDVILLASDDAQSETSVVDCLHAVSE